MSNDIEVLNAIHNTPNATLTHPDGTPLTWMGQLAGAIWPIIDTVRAEWARATEYDAPTPEATATPARRIIPVEGFHDMEHLLEDAEPAGIVPRPSR